MNVEIKDCVTDIYNRLIDTNVNLIELGKINQAYINRQNTLNKLTFLATCIGTAYIFYINRKRKILLAKVEKLTKENEELTKKLIGE